MKIGDTLVFISEDSDDEHFKNFTYGKKYKIKDYTHSEIFNTEIFNDDGHHTAVFFEDTKWGCLLVNIKKYFVLLDDYRDNKINQII